MKRVTILAFVLVTLVRTGNLRAQAPNSLSDQVQSLMQQGRYEEALPLARRAADIKERLFGPDDPQTASSLDILALAHELAGDFAKADSLYQRVLQIHEKTFGRDHPKTAAALNNLGFLHNKMDDFEKAEPLYRRALQILERSMPESSTTGSVLNNLGMLQAKLGQHAQAERLFQRALRIKETTLGPKHPETADVLGNLGFIHERNGDYSKAEELCQRALQIGEMALGKGHPATVGSLNNLAVLYSHMGAPAKAESLYQQALQIQETALGTNHPATAHIANNLASFEMSIGNYARAEELCRRALRAAEVALGPDHLTTATSLYQLGLALFNRDRTDEALKMGTRAAKAESAVLGNILSFAPESQRLSYQLTRHPCALPGTLGNAMLVAETVLHFKGVVLDSLIEDHLLASGSKDPIIHPKTQELQSAKQRLARSLVQVPVNLSAERRQRQAEERDQLTKEVERLESELARYFAGFGRARRTLTVKVEDVQKAILRNSVLVELVHYPHHLGAKGPVKSNGLREQWETRYGAVLIPHSGEPQWVPLGSAEAIEQNITRYQQAVRGSAPFGVPASAGPGADRLKAGLQTQTPDPRRETQLTTLLQALHQQLWAPIEAALPKGTKTVILSPDGQLSFVSFATLLAPDDRLLGQKYSLRYVSSGRDLLKQFQTAPKKRVAIYGNPDFGFQAPSPFVGRGERAGVRGASASLTLAPSGGEGRGEGALTAFRELELRDFRNLKLLPLPGTEQESKALAAQASRWHWEPAVHLGPNATEAALQTVQSPHILHLATHGFFLPDRNEGQGSGPPNTRGVGGIRPSTAGGSAAASGMETMTLNPFQHRVVLKNPMQRSGLALAGAMTTLAAWQRGETPDTANDGIVTAAEVGTLKLEGTWLVVLSACDTGAGEARSGEGVLGLRRGFIMAGTQNLLMTLWPVADEETAKFMAAFYERAHQSGNAAESLADIQRDWLVRLRQERGLAEAVRLAGPFILSSQGGTE